VAATLRTLPVPSDALRIETDEPGFRLILAGPAPGGPAALAIVAGVIFVIVAVPTVGGSLIDLFQSGFAVHGLTRVAQSALIPTLAVVLFLFSIWRSRRISRLAFDGISQQVEITQVRAFGGGRGLQERIPFASLQSLSVSATSPVTNRLARPGLKVTLQLRTEAGAQRQWQFSVAGLDQREEGADLALRLGAAAGFAYHHIVRSDQREIEIEFGRGRGGAFTPMPELRAKADYDRDQVPAEAKAMAAEEATPPFDPASFKGDHRIVVWQPGREVRFRKPTGLGAIGCAPGLLLLLVGPVYLLWAVGRPGIDLGSKLVGAGVLGFFGLVFGGISWLVVSTSLGRTVSFDWAERRMEVRSLRRRSYAFSQVRAVELKCVRTTGKGGGSYYCRLIVQVETPTETKSVELLWTEFYKYDPDTPYRMALPLATDLATALGVPRVITDFN
jgi:hypothetical protein